MSIGKLCDDDCIALFTKYHVKVIKDGKVVIVSKRNQTNGLIWNIPLSNRTTIIPPAISHMANGAIQDDATKHDLATYLHASAYSPVTSMFERAIKWDHYTSWPWISAALITKHLEKSTSTSKGHLHMRQKHTKSTKVIAAPTDRHNSTARKWKWKNPQSVCHHAR